VKNTVFGTLPDRHVEFDVSRGTRRDTDTLTAHVETAARCLALYLADLGNFTALPYSHARAASRAFLRNSRFDIDTNKSGNKITPKGNLGIK